MGLSVIMISSARRASVRTPDHRSGARRQRGGHAAPRTHARTRTANAGGPPRPHLTGCGAGSACLYDQAHFVFIRYYEQSHSCCLTFPEVGNSKQDRSTKEMTMMSVHLNLLLFSVIL